MLRSSVERKLFQFAVLGGIDPRINSLAPCSACAPFRLRRRDRLAAGVGSVRITGSRAGSPAAAFTLAARLGRLAMLSPFHVFLLT